ncbi:protein GLUTAMINE DUMPER 1-like [Benincasa hispida]|uniref:protein GLUTAMINE DUMPER 1-like n=1 Tax=Benincasa hispida TaxID=102211 RepID=UPI001902827D|nr:protein GLUTAMINE DUMPER 1-like [Benincasa hispida]
MEAAAPATPWHSPLPYLFGALAVISILISFSLLILGCSYCRKVSVSVLNGDNGAARAADMESDPRKGDDGQNPVPSAMFDDKVLVIMAGEVNPSFIATPMSLSLNCGKIMGCRENAAATATVAAEHGDGDRL